MYISDIPSNTEPLTLFRYCVQKAVSLDMMNVSKMHSEWAALLFSYEKKSFVRIELMSKVKSEYTAYFSKDLGPYTFLEDKIRANFPHFFGSTQNLNTFELIDNALDAECEEQRNPKNRKMYRVSSCSLLSSQDDHYIFKASLLVEDGDDPRFSEGVQFEYLTSDDKYYCEVVDFDYVKGILFFSTNRRIFITTDSRVVSDATMNTLALKSLLKEIAKSEIKENTPLYKFLNDTTEELSEVKHGEYPSYLNKILEKDKSQFEAFKAAINKDITFIWGPPGTGKSYTLSAIIMALYGMNYERTAVCCLSNVAVDQLVNKVVDIIEVHEPYFPNGKFYRAGRTQDAKLLSTNFLFPDDNQSNLLRLSIKHQNEELDRFRIINQQYSDEAIKLKDDLKNNKEKLKKHTDYLIEKVRVVFSTISNFIINPRLNSSEFDNLIVDEASMLALPQLIALAKNVKKRIILVGDFMQLSPISTSGVPMLRDSIFKQSGIDINNTDHPALHQLLNQRRSNPKLVDVINHTFYRDNLRAQNDKNSKVVARAPYSGSPVAMYSVEDGVVRFTKGGTRQNVNNANAVMKLLDLYSKDSEELFTIGVITPYKGQVSLLKVLFDKKGYDMDFQERVRIGSVHTFQGSECDVIIFDMVDASTFEKGNKTYFGRLFAGEQGEQLLNVAISRARHKLIVVCDPNFLDKCPGGKVSDKSDRIFKILLKYRYTQI